MDINQEQNLEYLIKEFRNKGKSAKGYREVIYLIRNKENRKLEILLRDHTVEPVQRQYEIDFRDNLDYLLEFYSLLTLGIISRYISVEIPSKLRNEIQVILSNEFVRKYYNKIYLQPLPALLFLIVNQDIKLPINEPIFEDIKVFNEFLVISRKDYDVDTFLWFLDDGDYLDESIEDLYKILKNEKRLQRHLYKKNKSYVDHALWGFIKYINYLEAFREILINEKATKQFRDAIWYYESYWFIELKDKLNKVLKKSIESINELITLQRIRQNEFSEEDLSKIKVESRTFIEKSKRNVDFILNYKNFPSISSSGILNELEF